MIYHARISEMGGGDMKLSEDEVLSMATSA